MAGNGSSGSKTQVFEQLYGCYEYPLYQLAYKVTRSDALARDILQEVFLRFWEHMDQVGELDDPGAYLYRSTQNKLIDFLRKAAADEKMRNQLWKQVSAVSLQPQDHLEAKESLEAIHAAISQLPPQRQKVFRLSREEGLNYQEIATEMAISRHTVKNQLSSALLHIRRFLTGK
ncbi:RNA polymerase sigma factor [Flavihumibacter petaseus]|uniref:Putative RNA polymerase ECF-type sigma factor n=1 Tax=Flavihumibacter petaseus NBRC 106054 TaxID=1220578 RepID=A0A0E9N460_9BACT|nr:RNA polymerase sigma-70 factor [Flavihumibacter petaseus]GAO44767.1 putative RNA polymerase ECF-type sigma factor [Flavihumibacter petaseus NBRC 106054]